MPTLEEGSVPLAQLGSGSGELAIALPGAAEF